MFWVNLVIHYIKFRKFRTVLFQDCFKKDLLRKDNARDTFSIDNLYLQTTEAPFVCNCDYAQTCIHTFMYVFRKVIPLFLLRRKWKLGEVLLGYIQYVLFIASRLFRAGGGEDIEVEGPHSSTLHFHKPGLVSLTHT